MSTIKNAKFSGWYFYMNMNIWGDFHICISVPLTSNHLLFGRQLYSSNTTSALVRNVTVLSSTADKINHISNQFLDR